MILDCQIEVIADMFIASALPEYKKTVLYEKINAMKEVLSDACEKAD